MKGDKATTSRPFSDFGDRQPSHLGNEGRQGGSGSQEQPRTEITQGDKAAGAAKSRPEWRSCRETNEGRRRQRAAQKGDHAGRLFFHFHGASTSCLDRSGA